jgi:hypothetical protein
MEQDPTLPLTVGIGIDAGEAVSIEEGYRGEALNVAARLCAAARAGEIFASSNVVHLAGRTEGLSYADRGNVRLRGLERPVRVFQVAEEGELPLALRPIGRSDQHDLQMAAMIVSLVGAGSGLLAALLTLSVSVLPHAGPFAITLVLASSVLGFVGAAWATTKPSKSAVVLIIAAIGLILSIDWVAALAALLFLIAAGLQIGGEHATRDA